MDNGASTEEGPGWEGIGKAEIMPQSEKGEEDGLKVAADNRDETMGASLGAAAQGHLVGVSVFSTIA